MRSALALAFLLFAACDGPCTQLANKICDCEPDLNSQTACRNQVSLDAGNVNPKLTKNDESYCNAKLATCSCSALAAGDRQSCGFQKEPNSP